jgi:transposase
VQLRYAFRLYPTPGQRIALAKGFGCARVVFNDGLRAREDARQAGLPFIGDAELSRRVITQAKKTPERAWLGEVSAVVLQLAKSVHDARWGRFVSILEFKAARYGRTFAKVARDFPSSQICSACWHRRAAEGRLDSPARRPGRTSTLRHRITRAPR